MRYLERLDDEEHTALRKLRAERAARDSEKEKIRQWRIGRFASQDPSLDRLIQDPAERAEVQRLRAWRAGSDRRKASKRKAKRGKTSRTSLAAIERQIAVNERKLATLRAERNEPSKSEPKKKQERPGLRPDEARELHRRMGLERVEFKGVELQGNKLVLGAPTLKRS